MAVGLLAAVLAPLEFSLFKDITKDLVGFRNLGFAVLAGQIFGLYLVAFVSIPLGYGHLHLRSWAHKLTLAALWSWIILGLPCIALVMLIFIGYKDPTDTGALIFGALTLFAYPVLPFLVVLFYRSSNTQALFEKPVDRHTWIEATPSPVLILGSVTTFFVFSFHIPLFLNGVVPFGCGFLSGLTGYGLASSGILVLAFVALGLFRQRLWAWYGGVIIFFSMAVNSTIAFLCSGSVAFLHALGARDLDVSQVELQFPSVHIAVLLCLPMVSTLLTMLFSRRHFNRIPTKGEIWVGLLALAVLIRLWINIWSKDTTTH